MSKVLILETEYENIDEAMEYVFDEFPLPIEGKSVFIKPNIIIGRPPQHAATTHPALVKAVVDACLQRGAEEVMVGDNPGGPENLVRPAAEGAGFLPLLERYFVDVGEESRVIEIDARLVSSVPVSSAILDADIIINVPKFKTHPIAGITGCIKNMFGVVLGLEKARLHSLNPNIRYLIDFLMKLYKVVTPDLNIVDAVMAMEGEGPSHGTPRHMGKVMAGYNGAEVDVVMASMLGLATEKLRFFRDAEQEGLGKCRMGDITVVGKFEALNGFTLPTINSISQEEIKLMIKHHGPLKPELDEERCTLCGRCLEVCFSDALEMRDYPHIDFQKCIGCWCCFEMCPEGAYSLPDARAIVEKIKAETNNP